MNEMTNAEMHGFSSRMAFDWRGERCAVEIEYAPNAGAEASGFRIFHDMPFDVALCKDYPTVHARVDTTRLRGYERYCGWIQFVKREEYDRGSEQPRISCELDCSEDMRMSGLPYFAFGYPAELFDAPCMNLNGAERLVWTADTYLVEMPVYRVNGNRLKFLTGFSWGYTEGANQQVRLLGLTALSEDDWRRDCACTGVQEQL